MFCPRCGANARDARFCPSCGTQLTQVAQQRSQQQPQQPLAQPPAQSPSRSQLPVVLAALLATAVVLALVGVGGFLLLRGSDDPGPASLAAADGSPTASPSAAPAPPTAPPTATATTTVTAQPKPKPSAGPGPVSKLPAGMFCRDLLARSYSYVAATDYWRNHGQPNQMDADRNGIPCETVYPPTDVSAYWSVRELPPAASVPDTLPSGLFCRDLRARGLDYAEAVSYWWSEGAPDRMDVERNGIPCETVYPAYDVNGFW